MDFTIPRSSATILLVGHAGIGKRRLASCIRSELAPPSNSSADAAPKSNTDISFRTAETLPLEKDGHISATLPLLRRFASEHSVKQATETVVESVVRYDLILFMVNMTNRISWDECKGSLLQLDPGCFLGRCAIVITRVAAVSKYAFDRDDITDFLDSFYDIPTIWTNLDVDSEATLTAFQVVRILEVSAGYRRRAENSLLFSISHMPIAPIVSSASMNGIAAAGGSKAKASMMPLATSTSSSFVGSNLGNRLTATHLLMKSPEKYTVLVTSLPGDEDETSGEDDMARVLSNLDSQE
ncbi:centromere protein M (CENP-M)-domain-containing protein [Gamsiella multidivaricata]|uniref:centromere protein M (CENP-M)-domain-containing protein n=1 Tax=Gamsiella multidivaricata TaxID=101098 RepID=UPI00221E3B0A|nr:centromere protein M (CENP-M)-domain-containing protein [Gamsiella multidivaricata]KAI7820053.1 centromere protein M (CENP-M)-domain-containing protein [Gamsiella multidivaricata]